MKFIDGLYFGPKAEHNKKELVRKLKKEKYLPGLWLITLPHNEGNILDMVEEYTLPYQGGLKDNLTVAGIAYGRDEALELVRQIVDDTYNKLFYEIKKDLFQIEKEGFTDALKSLISL